MIAVIQCQKRMNLNTSLKHCGIPKTTWYRRGNLGKKRDVRLDPVIARTVRVLGHERPSYGTRMMAAVVSRKLGVPINRKRIQRIYRKTDWIESTPLAELCRRYNLHPRTVYAWKERFIENGKAGFSRRGKDQATTAKKENDDLKRIVGEQALVIEAFKKTLEGRPR